MKVTVEMIAKEAGVSAPTVSRALKNDRLVHPQTRARIAAVAARLGYQGRSRRGRNQAEQVRILLLVASLTPYPPNEVLLSHLQGITAEVDNTGCQLTVEQITDKRAGKLSDPMNLPQAVRDGEIDIIISQGRHAPLDIAALAAHLPVVSLQWEYPGTRVDLAESFNARGISDLVATLAARGHRKMAWVEEHYPASFFRDRFSGFLQGCIDAGISPAEQPVLTYNQLLASEDAFLTTANQLKKDGVTALLCATDNVAREVALFCAGYGFRVPEDFSITGYDASVMTLPDGKTLTSYDPCSIELGRAALRVCLQRIAEPSSARIIQSREGRIRHGDTVASV